MRFRLHTGRILALTFVCFLLASLFGCTVSPPKTDAAAPSPAAAPSAAEDVTTPAEPIAVPEDLADLPLIAAYWNEHAARLCGWQRLSNGDLLIAEVQDGNSSGTEAFGDSSPEQGELRFYALSQKADRLEITDVSGTDGDLEAFPAFGNVANRTGCSYMFYPEANPTVLLLMIQPYNPFPDSYKVPVDYKDSVDFGRQPKDTLDTEALYIQNDGWNYGYPVWYFALSLEQITEDYCLEFGPDTLQGARILASMPAQAAEDGPTADPDEQAVAEYSAGDLRMELPEAFVEEPPQNDDFDAVLTSDACTVAVSHVDFSSDDRLAKVSTFQYAQKSAEGLTYLNQEIDYCEGLWLLRFDRYGFQRCTCFFFRGTSAWYTVMFVYPLDLADEMESQVLHWAKTVSIS